MAKSAPSEGDPEFGVWQLGYRQGKRDGEVDMRGRAIQFVTDRYTDIDNGPERGSPEGKMMLELLHDLGKMLKV